MFIGVSGRSSTATAKQAQRRRRKSHRLDQPYCAVSCLSPCAASYSILLAFSQRSSHGLSLHIPSLVCGKCFPDRPLNRPAVHNPRPSHTHSIHTYSICTQCIQRLALLHHNSEAEQLHQHHLSLPAVSAKLPPLSPSLLAPEGLRKQITEITLYPSQNRLYPERRGYIPPLGIRLRFPARVTEKPGGHHGRVC